METCKYEKIRYIDGGLESLCMRTEDLTPCIGPGKCIKYREEFMGENCKSERTELFTDINLYKNKPDMVNHPPHYKTKNGLETIEVIEAFTEDLTGIEAVDTANVLKYICRWKKKNGLQDLEKAQWYLNNLINHLKKESNDHE